MTTKMCDVCYAIMQKHKDKKGEYYKCYNCGRIIEIKEDNSDSSIDTHKNPPYKIVSSY